MKLDKSIFKGWSIGYDSGKDILNLLEKHKPQTILDLGSGSSSLMFGLWAQDNAANVISLEQSPYWYKETKKLLKKHNVEIDLRLVNLKEYPDGLFYDTEFPGDIDFALIDGPAWTGNGRKASFPVIYPYLSKNFTVWVDDAYRDLNRLAWTEWAMKYPIKVSKPNNRGLIIQ